MFCDQQIHGCWIKLNSKQTSLLNLITQPLGNFLHEWEQGVDTCISPYIQPTDLYSTLIFSSNMCFFKFQVDISRAYSWSVYGKSLWRPRKPGRELLNVEGWFKKYVVVHWKTRKIWRFCQTRKVNQIKIIQIGTN